MQVLVMGVAGSGKSTLGRALAERLGWKMLEGDDLHPATNVAKMRAGVPLTDEDRAPWLAAIAAQMKNWRETDVQAVICCSALKTRYRAILRAGDPDMLLVYLKLTPGMATARLAGRKGHFMPASLVASQFATLEEPDNGEKCLTLDAALPLDDELARVVAAIKAL